MPKLRANRINIEYQEFGDPASPPMLFIGGWSVQLTFWPQPFIDAFVDAGYRVIVFDNRDIGLSQKMRYFPPTSPFALHVLAARALKSRRLTAYTLEDMAEDARGVLDALGIDRAHILGLSMGGMITQILAAKHPDRVLSTTILMSSTNRLGLPLPPKRLAARILLTPLLSTAKASRRRSEKIWRTIRTQDGGYDEAQFNAGLTATVDRSHALAGRKRQLEAVIATGDLRRWTRRIKAPTLVIHGSKDLLAPPAGGKDIASCIPDARFELVSGMGHDLPPNRLDYLTNLIRAHLNSVSVPA
ncbi:alpha/beta fold hydrolase [Tropicibacter sp. R16_0]|uniref:alpha/beta fold hydrolase n=1 Tax=Tropicibacter sp. R16_0 TaxID=2821102 RepID=UPI001ADA15AB|nr:alpha/beta fold hydrolase [Tropicibacter sp. R16_0]